VPVFGALNRTDSSAVPGLADAAMNDGQEGDVKHDAVNWKISFVLGRQTQRSRSLPFWPFRTIRYVFPCTSRRLNTSLSSAGHPIDPVRCALILRAPSMLPSVLGVAFVVEAVRAASASTRPCVRVNFPLNSFLPTCVWFAQAM
jgi:hypothetical protein